MGLDCNISLSSPNFDKRGLSNKDVDGNDLLFKKSLTTPLRFRNLGIEHAIIVALMLKVRTAIIK